MKTELKPCPFCGGIDLLIKQAVIAEYYDETPFIVCEHCGITIKVKELCIDLNLSAPENEDWWNNETAEKWNTRPVEDEMYRNNEQTLTELEQMIPAMLAVCAECGCIRCKDCRFAKVIKTASDMERRIEQVQKKARGDE